MGKCKIKMGDKVRPVEGSVSGPERDRTGTCPECETPGVALSIVGGYVRAHTVSSTVLPENNPQAASVVPEKRAHKHAGRKVGKGLSEPVVDLTDTGVRTGDPRAAEQRRTAEINGAAGIGTVKVPRKVPGKGKLKSGAPRMTTKLIEVEATEAHVREARDYWLGRRITKQTSDAVRKRQTEMVSLLSRQLESIMAAQVVKCAEDGSSFEVLTLPVVAQEHLRASVDAAQGHRGPTLVKGRDTVPRARDAAPAGDATEASVMRDPHATTLEPTDIRRGGAVRKTTTLDQPLGRERFDRKITDVPEPPRRRTRGETRRYRRKLAAQRAIEAARG